MKIIKHESGRKLELYFWLFGWWGTGFFPTDIGDMWGYAKIRPKWYWWIKRVELFSGLVFRLPDPRATRGIDIDTAWDVSEVAEGISIWKLQKGKAPDGDT